MCGVAGSIGHLDSRRVDAVKVMTLAQRHRGPDDEGSWSFTQADAKRGVALGHRRLAILDLSAAGHQPMVDPESGCVICYNGEVYNFLELRRELEAEGARFASNCDTEVILKGFARWGERVIERLRGMFAIALWDPRSSRLLLARDRLGIKPLYYAVVGDGAQRALYFASEIRALLATGDIPRRLDRTGLATYLWNGVVMGPRTLIEGVRLLPAGTSLSVGLDARPGAPRRYWQLPGSQPSSDSDRARNELGSALREAVSMRLLADVPLGIFLSGGVDSSAVTALAVRSSEARITTCNIGFDEARYDESEHARAVAQALSTDHREVRLTGDTFRRGMPEALESLDQPTFDAINTYFVSKAVREAGLTVALAGTGGDELYGGYTSFRDLPLASQASRFTGPAPEPLLRAVAGVVTRLKLGPQGAVPPQTRWGKLGDVLAARGRMLELYQTSYALFTRSFISELSGAAAWEDVECGLPRERAQELAELIESQPALHAVSSLELACFLGERLLRDTDTASMAVALEVRVPLIDHVVVERLSAVPEAMRYRPLGRKALLRELALSELDPKLFDRPKRGFELPLEAWCRDQLGDDIDATLRDRALCERAGLRGDTVARLWQAFRDGAPGLYWSRVWALYVLLWWCRRHEVSL
jgi:asparagine synthase (glutamine-hydrolysing)